MNNQTLARRAQWSSLPNYLLVTIGAVVGLGNVFQFPFLVIHYGGIFVLFYVLFELFISIPLMFSDLIIGRRGKQNPVGAFSILSMEVGASRRWRWVGWTCVIASFLTLTTYIVSVTFPLSYFSDIAKTIFLYGSKNVTALTYTDITNYPLQLEASFFIFLLLTTFIIIRGINRGLETISRITVPVYFVLLLLLAIYTCAHGNFVASVKNLFNINFDHNALKAMVAALLFAFFKLNTGMGSLIVYGSYLPYKTPLGKTTAIIVIFDAIISLLAYFTIYPFLLLAQSMGFNATHDLSYHNMLTIFSMVPNGLAVGGLFFLAGVIAAWTATIAMAETVTVTLIERFKLRRHIGAIVVSAAIFVLGTIIVLSYQFGADLYVNLQGLSGTILVPLAALLTAIFLGWIVKREISFHELGFKTGLYSLWLFLMKIIVPISIIGIWAISIVRINH